jgi:hypothetical protein
MMKMFLFRRATAPRDAERRSLLSTAAVSKRFEDEDDSLALLSQLHQQQQSTPLGLSPEDEAAAKRSLLKQVPGDDAGMSDLILELVLRHFLPSIKKQLSLYLEQNTQHIHTLCGTTEQEVRFYASQATLQHSEGASFHSQSSSSSLTSVTRVASSVMRDNLVASALDNTPFVCVLHLDLVSCLNDVPKLGEKFLLDFRSSEATLSSIVRRLFSTRFFAEFKSCATTQDDVFSQLFRCLCTQATAGSECVKIRTRLSSLPSAQMTRGFSSYISGQPLTSFSGLVLSVHDAKKADVMLDKRGPIQLVPVLDRQAYYPSQTIIVAVCDERDKILSTQLHLYLRDELVEAFAPGDKVRGIATFSPWHPDQMELDDAEAKKKTKARGLPITHFHGDVNNLWLTATHIASFRDNGCQSARETRRMLLDAAATEFDDASLSYDGLQLSDWLLTESILVAFADAVVPSFAYPKLK